MDPYGGAARSWDGFLPQKVRPLSLEEKGCYEGKRILITGAGGYLGSALARAVAAYPLAQLVLLDQAEYGLYRLEHALGERESNTFLVGSVLDRALLKEVFARHTPDLVFHAAALKHVPLMEHNPFAAVETNILGTQAVVDAAAWAGKARLVLVSTDKAADPVSIMGATKWVAEQILLQQRDRGRGEYVSARLCNVLGSTGSVAPLFSRQAARGGPCTLTHAEATRFFVSRRDAVRFLLRTGVTSIEAGVVAPVLDQPSRISDLAAYIWRQQHGDTRVVRTVETGLRPGEKLHEQLLSAGERGRLNREGTLMEVTTALPRTRLTEALQEFASAVQARRPGELMAAFQRVLPQFRQQAASTVTGGHA